MNGWKCEFSIAEPQMTTFERASVCTLDCPDTCSLTVTVDDTRIVKVRGSRALPYTDGVICSKVGGQRGPHVSGVAEAVKQHDHWAIATYPNI